MPWIRNANLIHGRLLTEIRKNYAKITENQKVNIRVIENISRFSSQKWKSIKKLTVQINNKIKHALNSSRTISHRQWTVSRWIDSVNRCCQSKVNSPPPPPAINKVCMNVMILVTGSTMSQWQSDQQMTWYTV